MGTMSAAVRRQSVAVDFGGTGGAAGVPSSHRAAFIMTSAQSRRMSVSNPAASAISRSYENTYKTEPVSVCVCGLCVCVHMFV